MIVPAFFSDYQERVDRELRRLVPGHGGRVQQSMAYTVHAPSKRVRAILTLLCAEPRLPYDRVALSTLLASGADPDTNSRMRAVSSRVKSGRARSRV